MEAEYYFVWFPFLSRELVCFSPISSFFFRFSCQKQLETKVAGYICHQVGVIDGLMTTFLDVDSVVVKQVVPMTRFTIRTLDLYCEGWGRYPKFWSADSFWESLHCL